MGRSIIHVDMDAFYASVEVLDNPALAGRPVIVGGPVEGRGVVSAASYEARRYGVHSAMPSATARRLCPDGVFLPPRHGRYAEISAQLHTLFQRYTPVVEPLALDEAFLDVTDSRRLFGEAEAIGRALKREIRQALGLVASVGVAPNKYLAKLASDIHKPDGFLVITAEEAEGFLAPLPVSRLWGVGKRSAASFERLGIRTIGQLRHYSPRLLQQHFGQHGEQLLQLARGLDARPVVPDREAKSISNETTFAVDIDDRAVLLTYLHELTEEVGRRLRRAELLGRTVQLKARYADFTTVTRAHTLSEATDVTRELWLAVRQLYETRLPAPHPPLRLIGMGVSGLTGERAPQQALFDEEHRRQGRLDALVDAINERFGDSAVSRGKRVQ